MKLQKALKDLLSDAGSDNRNIVIDSNVQVRSLSGAGSNAKEVPGLLAKKGCRVISGVLS